jgi:hypothetical protein
LFVEDYTNGRIQVFDLSGGISNDVPASFSITGTSYTGALSYDPLSSTLILSDGLTYNVPILYIPANQASNISLVSAQIDTAGNTAACSMAPAGPNQSEFCSPGNAVYDDSSNNLFASDPLNNRILVFNFVIQSPATPPTNSVALPDTVSGFTHSVAPVDTTVTDNSKSSISKVQISLDGALTSTINSPPFNYNLPTTSVLDGTHTVSVKSFDSNGNTTTTQQTILVNNGDLNEDGTVTISDLAIMAVHWGATSSATYAEGSIMGDGAVNVSDLSVMAANWGWSAN